MTSRNRKPTGEKTHSQHPARTRHSDSTNASPLSNSSPANGDPSDRGAPAEERDQLAAVTDLAMARRRRQTAHANRVHGTPNVERPILGLDRQALDAKTSSGTEGCSINVTITSSTAPGAVAVYPQPRRCVERQHRERVLRRVADDLGLGRSDSTGPAVGRVPDGARGARVSLERLLRQLVGRAMAEHVTTVLGLPLGPTRYW